MFPNLSLKTDSNYSELFLSTLLSSENDESVSFSRTLSNSWLLAYTRKTLKWEDKTPTKGSKCCLKVARVILLSTCTINPKQTHTKKQKQKCKRNLLKSINRADYRLPTTLWAGKSTPFQLFDFQLTYYIEWTWTQRICYV